MHTGHFSTTAYTSDVFTASMWGLAYLTQLPTIKPGLSAFQIFIPPLFFECLLYPR
jgi:hypothetical protein